MAVTKGVKPTQGIRRLLEQDPAQRLYDQMELVQHKADLRTLIKVIRRTRAIQKEWGRPIVGWVHVTDTQLPCDRLLAAALLGMPAPRSFIPPRTRRIFDNGTYTHLRYQSYFYHLPKPFKVEAPKLLKFWPVGGEADIVVSHPEIGNWVIELKTINNVQWRGLARPIEGHAYQLNCYLGLRGREWGGQVWYENKNDQEPKLFTVPPDRFGWEQVLRHVSDVGYQLLATERLPKFCRNCPDPAFCETKIICNTKLLEAVDEQRRSGGSR
jgi:hypothetical protein